MSRIGDYLINFLARRAEGGPIAPTWGTQTPEQATSARAAEQGAQWAAEQDARQARERQAFLTGPYGGDAARAIEARNRDTLATADKLRMLGIAPRMPTEKDYARASSEERKRLDDQRREALDAQAMERQARFGLSQQAEQDAAVKATGAAASEENAPPMTTGQRALNAVGDFGSNLLKQGMAIDTSYHGPQGGYAAPQFVALPEYRARAAGGPILARGGGRWTEIAKEARENRGLPRRKRAKGSAR